PKTAIPATPTLDLTLINGGTQDSGPLPAIATTGDPAFTVVAGGTCMEGASVAGGGSCTVRVRFTPTVPGTVAGAISLAAPPGGTPTATTPGTEERMVTLTITNPNNGDGDVSVDGVACGGLPCMKSYLDTAGKSPAVAQLVNATSSTFGGWSGDCSGSGACAP